MTRAALSACIAAAMLGASPAVTTRRAVAATPCTGRLSRADVIGCAISNSPDVKLVATELRALAGRRHTASVLLPANPTVGVQAGWRRGRRVEIDGTFPTATNWYVTLQQEIEVAGQRGTRLAVVDAEIAAEERRADAVRQTVAAVALRAWYELLGAEAAASLTTELASTGELLERAADARAKEGLVSALDADLARAEAVRVKALRLESERRREEARATVALVVAGDPATAIEIASRLDAELPPLEAATIPLEARLQQAADARADLATLALERQVAERVVAQLRRARLPNPTLSFAIQNDGFDELVVLGGLSLPIPLPAPVGRTLAGEIATARAEVERAALTRDAAAREVRLEVIHAHAQAQARAARLRLHSPELIGRARAHVGALADAIAARTLSLREAVIAQRALVELLLGAVEAQREWALAWVELERASGGFSGGGGAR
jgi:cobalt-zinc-cadmium efflux system outer membrane protein